MRFTTVSKRIVSLQTVSHPAATRPLAASNSLATSGAIPVLCVLLVAIIMSSGGCSREPAAAVSETVFRQRSSGELLRVTGSAADRVDSNVYERVLYSPAAKKWFPAPSAAAMERMPLGPVCPETGVPLLTTDSPSVAASSESAAVADSKP